MYILVSMMNETDHNQCVTGAVDESDLLVGGECSTSGSTATSLQVLMLVHYSPHITQESSSFTLS